MKLPQNIPKTLSTAGLAAGSLPGCGWMESPRARERRGGGRPVLVGDEVPLDDAFPSCPASWMLAMPDLPGLV
ncbi:MAG: hypothetical protein IJJ26_09190 [Victivallales bacterium]|nr:hypothetical protein [Victivallales bacterium]